MPLELHQIPSIAILCRLNTENDIYSSALMTQFANLSKIKLFQLAYIKKHSIPAVVNIYENGVNIFEETSRLAKLSPNQTNIHLGTTAKPRTDQYRAPLSKGLLIPFSIVRCFIIL